MNKGRREWRTFAHGVRSESCLRGEVKTKFGDATKLAPRLFPNRASDPGKLNPGLDRVGNLGALCQDHDYLFVSCPHFCQRKSRLSREAPGHDTNAVVLIWSVDCLSQLISLRSSRKLEKLPEQAA
jgi:hypothetical protein